MQRGDLSQLPGTHRLRVFLGGAYAADNRRLLEGIKHVVQELRFVPIIADDYELLHRERDVHDVTLWLLHACRLAVFEVSTLSGALMEVERLRDYGVRKALLLYQHPGGQDWPHHESAWRSSQMLKSLAREQPERLFVRPYARPRQAFSETRRFLQAVRRSAYGKLHGL